GEQALSLSQLFPSIVPYISAPRLTAKIKHPRAEKSRAMAEEVKEVKGRGVLRRPVYVYKRHHLFSFLIAFLILLGVIALIVWLVYRPSKPSFRVVDATIHELDARTPGAISTSMQFTVETHNPSKRATAFYDRLSAYISYRDQMITERVQLPPMIQENDGTVVISLVVGGVPVPASHEVVNGLATDEAYGMVGLRLVILGRVKWKMGAFGSGHDTLYVTCDVLVGVQNGQLGQVPLLGPTGCKVEL
ncbi:hypothetical protein ACLOJK_004575, partial [Asimina triloba]